MADRLTTKERLKNKTDILYFSFSKGQVHCKDIREMRRSKKKGEVSRICQYYFEKYTSTTSNVNKKK